MGFQSKWDPVSQLLRVGLNSTNVILILISLSVVLWEGYQVTNTYMSQPISTEQKLLPLSSIPNILMSICRSFEITDCKFPLKNQPTKKNCSSYQLPMYSINQSDFETFFTDAVTSQRPIQFRDIMDYIWIWNESQTIWKKVYDSSIFSRENDSTLYTQQIYPYNGNNTLLCYTLKEDIRSFAPMLKFQRKGNLSIIFKIITLL